MLVYLVMMGASILALICARREKMALSGYTAVLATPSHKARLMLWYVAAFLIPFLVAALRYEVGADYNSYIILYNIEMSGEITYIEPGFRLLYRFIAWLGLHIQSLFVITSFLILFPIVLCIPQYSAYPALSLFLFYCMGFYFYSLSGLRQYIALAISFYAFRYLINKNFPMYALCILVAATFHKSVLIMLALYWLLQLRMRLSYYCALGLLGVLTTVFQKSIMQFIFSFVYAAYDSRIDFHISYYNILLSFVIMLGCLAYYKVMQKTQKNLILFNCAFFSFLAYTTLLGWLGSMLSRLLLYLNFYHIITIPEIICAEKRVSFRIVYMLIVIIGFFCYCMILFQVNGADNNRFFPYQSIFTK